MELKYFPGPGRAEVIRILLHAAGVDWKDTRVTGKEWATAVKATTPLGSMPVLTVQGVDFCQSVSLQRYAAKLAGLYPQDDDDALKALVVDEVMDVLNEVLTKAPFGAATEAEKKEKREAYQKNEMPKYFGLVEKRIQTFGHGKTVCGVPSVADIHLMVMVQGLESGNWDYIDVDFFKKGYPGIKACVEQTVANEKVKAYYDSLAKKKDEL